MKCIYAVDQHEITQWSRQFAQSTEFGWRNLFFSGGEESVAKMFFFRLIIRKLSEFCRVDQIRWRPCL